jgi:hypothetical protein
MYTAADKMNVTLTDYPHPEYSAGCVTGSWFKAGSFTNSFRLKPPIVLWGMDGIHPSIFL